MSKLSWYMLQRLKNLHTLKPRKSRHYGFHCQSRKRMQYPLECQKLKVWIYIECAQPHPCIKKNHSIWTGWITCVRQCDIQFHLSNTAVALKFNHSPKLLNLKDLAKIHSKKIKFLQVFFFLLGPGTHQLTPLKHSKVTKNTVCVILSY